MHMIRKVLLVVFGVTLVVTATIALSSYWWAGMVHYYTPRGQWVYFSWDYGSVGAGYLSALAYSVFDESGRSVDIDTGWNVRLLKRPTSSTDV